ncbi:MULTISPECIES: threonine ammonia-lyase, biosynthetic [Methylobacterium]|uniref:L-threonine dehydratase n=2 Tax=Pseudomonadota TaxID=1224 RepID=A0ABQ4SYK6_9HYPH|nr:MULTISPECIES: threonine ammonia-lyase, biosynthetic [Methylobacterium]PIU07135.1 MAG: threonine ammonia-lyase, biosynthetic [Methylobacterium sp. CG09_land_8_20_14_0_10_71_15]PIU15626.1 MAG: threonine ammonia-lyase, biosynthetic [Methylobacterium sp. CG08_land_8_20_14_0_20_71_15]GBU18913.1 l-threonine dehydratase [Methylobacterium sp.]GJE08294.1 L-threonine dehydratase biosynthetic IlvA [Methylobacterium jeotgali]
MTDYIRKILDARVYDVASESPLDAMPRLSARLGRPVLLKREDLQPVFSFKLRGAYNKMTALSAEELARGVICASAGNHAQGVALGAQRLGVRAVIVMPRTTPAIKVEACRARGAEVVLHGDAFDDALAEARRREAEEGLSFLHPFDDPEVIAGQGTIGKEILSRHSGPIEAIFVPVGGGGLAAGIAAFVKYLRPQTKVFGVEPDDAACMAAALAAGEPVNLPSVGLFADGVAVRRAGEETFRLCREHLDGIVTVDTDAMCAAVKDIFDDTRAVSEPSGALALAGAKAWAEREGGTGTLVAISSGANLNFDRLRHIAERAEIGEQREVLLGVTIPERPGAYRAFIRALGPRAITEFNYRYAPGAAAHIFVGVNLPGGPAEKRALAASLSEAGYGVHDLSDNEMAKVHIRYMVGGRASGLADERLYRFQFPERPGALMNFLDRLGEDFNITLFHYRNHGADYGRVLAGIAVPEAERARFDAAIEALGYPCTDETGNPAYRLFLGNGEDGRQG